MTSFFSIADNSFDTRGFPWVDHIVSGAVEVALPSCPECGVAPSRIFSGDLDVTLEKRKGSKWPDALGCGAASLFIVSARVLDAWHHDEAGTFPIGGRISFTGPFPKPLQDVRPPEYFWLDGEKMLGAKMDFDASGFVDVRFCSACGNRTDDISATHDKQRSGPWPYAFVPNTWNGANLFTTDLSPAAFFCTDAVMQCARRHHHTNFRLIPVEAGGATWSPGIDYLGKQWPAHHALRASEGKTVAEWVEQLREPSKRYEARVALLDLGKDAASAIRTLTGLLHDNDEGLRREAALLFSALARVGVPLPRQGKAAARQHDDWFQKTLGSSADA
ncbi:MAG: hypothetical protein WD063_02885 [Pirellulales bacterium]